MRKFAYPVFILILLLNISLLAQPKITVGEETFDFGNIKEGVVVQHDYKITNSGDEDLIIEKVRASCGCTAAAPEKDLLKPGESTHVKVKFNSARRHGVQKKYVYFFTNDPEKPQYRVSFTANIMDEVQLKAEKVEPPNLSLEKKEIDLGTINEGETVNTIVSLTNEGTETIVVKDVKSSCGCISASLSNNEIAPGAKGDLRLEFNSTDRSGKMIRTITLHTTDQENPNYTIVLYANVIKEKS